MIDENNDHLLGIEGLTVQFTTDRGVVKAVNNADIEINPGQSVGIVGESGCGKTVTAYSILQILPPAGEIVSGQIYFRSDEGVVELSALKSEGSQMRKVRGGETSMVFQEPMTAFSPVYSLYNQISEAILLHQDMKKSAARERVVELFDLVGIPNPSERVDDYPFQFSGGMRQRAMIAMALACNPKILIADEPTTALDVTTQAQVLQLIQEMQDDFDLSLLLITHDLGVIAHMVDYVNVMYLGSVVEEGPVNSIFKTPQHPYTKSLMGSIPKVTGTEKIVSIEGSVPSAANLPSGCPFHPRCPEIIGEKCKREFPSVYRIEENHEVCCHLFSEEENGS